LPGSMEAFLDTDEGKATLRQISDLLCYRHAWIRLVSSRLVGQYLDRRSPSDATKCFYVGDQKEAFTLVRRLCVQLDRPQIAEELTLRTVKNLVFMAAALVQKGGGVMNSSAAANGDKEWQVRCFSGVMWEAGIEFGDG